MTLSACGDGTDTAEAAPRPHMEYFVSPDGVDENPGTNVRSPFRSIQKALDRAGPGDRINLAPGDYFEDLRSVRDGEKDAPIRISGAPHAVVKGTGEKARVVEISHSHIVLSNFSIDGAAEGNAGEEAGAMTNNAKANPAETDEAADEEVAAVTEEEIKKEETKEIKETEEEETKEAADTKGNAYRDKLIFVLGEDSEKGVTGVRVLGMDLRNAGGECLRLKYFAHHNEVAYSTFNNCGINDFRLGGDGKNGEAIYVGTAPEQGKKNPTSEPDASNHNWVHDNFINTGASECVDIKEGSSYNIIEYNQCTGGRDADSGGMSARGNNNVFRYNLVYSNEGAGIRLGGDTAKDGIENKVYGNTLLANNFSGLKVMTGPQALICGNTIGTQPAIRGEAAKGISPEAPCDLSR
jgi:hypothetical protein